MSNRTVVLCLMMLALGSAAGAAIMRFELLPGVTAPATSKQCHCDPCPDGAREATASGATENAHALPATHEDTAPRERPVDASWFEVCEAADDTFPVSLQPVELGGKGELFAVRCGARLQLLSLQGVGAEARITRVARIEAHAPSPDLHVLPSLAAAADLNRDGRSDLLAGFAFYDRENAPRGGALYVSMRDADRGLARPLQLSSAAIASFALGRELFIVHLEDARLTKASELIVMHGGASPVRAAAAPIAVGARAVAAIDLDLDGNDDALVTGAKPELEALYLDAKAAVRERVSWPLANAREVVSADLDGDAHADAAIAGDSVAILLASNNTPREPRIVAAQTSLRGVEARDQDGDGHLDLVGMSGDELIALLQRGDTFERRSLCKLDALPVQPLTATLRSDADGAQAVVVLGRDRATSAHLQLAVLACKPDAPPVFPRAPASVPDAVLAYELVVPPTP